MSQDEAIVIGRTDLGEADRIVRLLTPTQGRVDAMARGARRSRKRFGGALEPGTRLRVDLRRGKGPLPILAGCDVIAAPRRVREDYDRLTALLYGCELLGALSKEGMEGQRAFRLLEAWLAACEADPAPGVASRVALEGKALTFAGLLPALRTCARCGEPLVGPVQFDLDAGGGVHLACGRGEPIHADTLATVDDLRRVPLIEIMVRDAARRAIPPGAMWLLTDFVEYQLGKGLATRASLGGLA